MPYFHVTYAKYLDSIRRHGLGGNLVEQNYPGCSWGVYLCDAPEIGATILLSNVYDDPAWNPRRWTLTVRVIVIDDSRIDPSKLGDDPDFIGSNNIRLYRGVIDITNLPVLTLDQAMPKEVSDREPDVEKARQFFEWLDVRKYEHEHGLPPREFRFD